MCVLFVFRRRTFFLIGQKSINLVSVDLSSGFLSRVPDQYFDRRAQIHDQKEDSDETSSDEPLERSAFGEEGTKADRSICHSIVTPRLEDLDMGPIVNNNATSVMY